MRNLENPTTVFNANWFKQVLSACTPLQNNITHIAFQISDHFRITGKTTILYKLKLGEIVTTIPTIGMAYWISVYCFFAQRLTWITSFA